MTGRITIVLFTTLDGVAQAPGGPDEDPEGGFPYGGWQAPLFDSVVGEVIGEGIDKLDALVLGRKTYDIFAGYWPQHTEGDAEGVIGRKFDEIPKYVASRTPLEPEWQNTTQLGPDAAAEVAALREKHDNIQVIGSIDFVQTLLAAEAYDELALWVYPIVLGQGKKVFPDGATPANLKLVTPPVTGSSGAVLLRYAPAGKPTMGDMSDPDRGV
jgi:dihydrofolate reductase